MARKLRYKLHWASSQERPVSSLKWVIYDWSIFGPVAYVQTRVLGRKICDLLNQMEGA